MTITVPEKVLTNVKSCVYLGSNVTLIIKSELLSFVSLPLTVNPEKIPEAVTGPSPGQGLNRCAAHGHALATVAKLQSRKDISEH